MEVYLGSGGRWHSTSCGVRYLPPHGDRYHYLINWNPLDMVTRTIAGTITSSVLPSLPTKRTKICRIMLLPLHKKTRPISGTITSPALSYLPARRTKLYHIMLISLNLEYANQRYNNFTSTFPPVCQAHDTLTNFQPYDCNTGVQEHLNCQVNDDVPVTRCTILEQCHSDTTTFVTKCATS